MIAVRGHVWVPLALVLATDAAPLPVIQSFTNDDPVYTQHQWMVSEYHVAVATGEDPPGLLLMEYTPRPDETIFSISAALMLSYASIATANRLSDTRLPGRALLIPNQPGLLVFAEPRSDLERAIARRLRPIATDRTGAIEVVNDDGRAWFVAGADFTPEERDRFLRVRFAHPLPGARVSSPFGYRSHPITGVWTLHRGVDLAAGFGEPVRAAASGVVAATVRDPWLGLSLTIAHRDGYETVYAHLGEVVVEVGETVTAGSTIGTVGSTGYSTGPHLHFEVRSGGESRDPALFIEGVRR